MVMVTGVRFTQLLTTQRTLNERSTNTKINSHLRPHRHIPILPINSKRARDERPVIIKSSCEVVAVVLPLSSAVGSLLRELHTTVPSGAYF